MAPEFELSTEADLDNLREVRSFVKNSGQALGAGEEAVGDLCLVVDEAVTNIILHGYAGQGGPVDVHVERDGDALVVLIRDRAKVFDPSDVETPHLDTALAERAYGGMGVYLIKKLTDEHQFRARSGGGNELRLVRRGAISGKS